jgi:OmcA/MtrC family decaheme c-type cytochrome
LVSHFDTPWLRFDHAVTSEIKVVSVTELATTDYTLDATTGTITEVTEFGEVTVLASYTSDYVIPSVFPPAINDSPDLTATWGKWVGLPLVDGTYTVGIWGERQVRYSVGASPPEVTNYNGVSDPATMHFLVGSASQIEPPAIISGAETCMACHNDLWFHGGHRRGLDTCLVCHGAAGSEDGPRYVWSNGQETPGQSIEFRRMLHKIHMGENLTNASTYQVVGFGGSSHFYSEVVFPSTPGGVMKCVKCHGTDAWERPMDRNHPDGGVYTSAWLVACGSCHDATHAQAHISIMTAQNGAESCRVCHDRDKELAVERVHRHW